MVASKPHSSSFDHSPLPTLKKRADFLRLRQGKKASGPSFTLQCAPRLEAGGDGSLKLTSRVGYTVTTRVGNAVERNRIRRRLREVAKQGFVSRNPEQKYGPHDYVVLARRSVLCGDFQSLVNEFTRALDRLHMNRSKGTRQTH